MGIFSKPEVIILKESNSAKEYLELLEELLPKASEEIKSKIEKEIIIIKAGIAGENNILFELKNSNMDMYVLQDIYIETEDGRGAQIDFIVITEKIIFFIECKNLVGNIDIDSKGNFVRTVTYGRKKYKEGIYSPITQNERHMEIVKESKLENRNLLTGMIVRKSFHSFNRSLVVLANPKTVLNDRYAKKEVKEKVIRADQLITTIKKVAAESRLPSSSKKEMKEIAESFLKRNQENRKNYIEKYEELTKEIELEKGNTSKVEELKDNSTEESSVKETEMRLICPKCGKQLVLRTARRGANAGRQFYGCSNFPKCRFIMNIADE